MAKTCSETAQNMFWVTQKQTLFWTHNPEHVLDCSRTGFERRRENSIHSRACSGLSTQHMPEHVLECFRTGFEEKKEEKKVNSPEHVLDCQPRTYSGFLTQIFMMTCSLPNSPEHVLDCKPRTCSGMSTQNMFWTVSGWHSGFFSVSIRIAVYDYENISMFEAC